MAARIGLGLPLVRTARAHSSFIFVHSSSARSCFMRSCLAASSNCLSFAIVLYQSETAKVNLWMPSHCPALPNLSLGLLPLLIAFQTVEILHIIWRSIPCRLSIEHLGKLHFFILTACRAFYRSNHRFLRFRRLHKFIRLLRKGKEA